MADWLRAAVWRAGEQTERDRFCMVESGGRKRKEGSKELETEIEKDRETCVWARAGRACGRGRRNVKLGNVIFSRSVAIVSVVVQCI